jgi:hypothetical protein
MMMTAIDARHAAECVLLAFQSASQLAHGARITVREIHHFDRDQLRQPTTACDPRSAGSG